VSFVLGEKKKENRAELWRIKREVDGAYTSRGERGKKKKGRACFLTQERKIQPTTALRGKKKSLHQPSLLGEKKKRSMISGGTVHSTGSFTSVKKRKGKKKRNAARASLEEKRGKKKRGCCPFLNGGKDCWPKRSVCRVGRER